MANVLLLKIDGYKDSVPFGLLYIASSLLKNGHSVTIIHKSLTADTEKNILMLAKKSHLVGFSVTTSPNIREAVYLSKKIKKIYNKKIVWGGVHPTAVPEVVLSEYYVDYIVLSEGEERILNILDHALHKTSLELVDGIGYKDNNETVIRPHEKIIADLDKYDLPWDKIDIGRYIQIVENKKEFRLITSRGCPHKCTFCYNQFFNKRLWRAHSEDYVIKEVEYLKKFDINVIRFIDDNFFTDIERGFRIVSKIGLPWIGGVRANLITEEFIKRCKETKCLQLNVGVESGSDRMLKYIRKEVTTEQIINAVKLATRNNIRIFYSLIMGFPKETDIDRLQTVELIKRIISISKLARITGLKIYTPYPGTPMYCDLVEAGFRPPKSNIEYAGYVTRFKHLNSPWLSRKTAYKIKFYYYATLIIQKIFSLSFFRALLKRWDFLRAK